MKATNAIDHTDILGVNVSTINLDEACSVIDSWIAFGHRRYVCVTGVHGVMESQRDEHLRAIHNQAGLVTPDGMPLVWISRARGFAGVGRVYGPDLMLALCAFGVTRSYRHFFYGGTSGVPQRLAIQLRKQFPQMVIVGAYSPPFRSASTSPDPNEIAIINEARADIVWVGLSTPKQEHWMAAYRSRLAAPVLIGVGAAFDFIAGTKRQAPRWMMRAGMEWIFRLMCEPRRLAGRYMINNPKFVGMLAAAALKRQSEGQ
jgi:N-acetylglucosaminyldiphosphoundecaprenol N-acetyl-beta-D-mannosaminyltransferase